MSRTSRVTATALLFVSVTLFFGLGCSHDNSTDSMGLVSSSPLGVNMTVEAVVPVATDTVTFVEGFDNMQNEGNWSYGTTHDPIIEMTGGNPDWYVHDPLVVSFAPHPMSGLGVQSIFSGDYKARRVVSVGIDLRSFDYDGNLSSRYLTLMLMNDNGTPEDVGDDWGAYIIGPTLVPSKYVDMKVSPTVANAAGWVSYDFEILSQNNRLPTGWEYWRSSLGGGGKTGGTWSELMLDVDYVEYFYGDPTSIFILDTYDLGLDNARISYEEVL